VVYLFAEDRKGQHVHEHLTGFSGVLQVDGYADHRELTRPDRPGGAITLAFCLAHARRRFFEIYKSSGSKVAEQALWQIRAVYEIETRIRGFDRRRACAHPAGGDQAGARRVQDLAAAAIGGRISEVGPRPSDQIRA